MPRPSKQISPDTLGGHLRAARERLHLSLAEVGNGHYSTSLISQIERNRIEPSQESLRFLAERLRLPLEDLEILAQQNRERENKASNYKSFEDLRISAMQIMTNKDILQAIHLLKDLYFPQVPTPQRWRLAALRGQCYFEQRKFLKAQQDFGYALNELPRLTNLTAEQQQEVMLLYLHLAGTYRELQQPEAALENYKITLLLVNRETPFGYVAEAQWGMALIFYGQAHEMQGADPSIARCKTIKLKAALEHAQIAKFLYYSIGEQLRAAAVTCQIAQIEQTLGDTDKVKCLLQEILADWSSIYQEPIAGTPIEKRRQQEIANIVSSAAYSLATIELEARCYEQAKEYANQALAAGKRCYKLRRADAHLIRGRILAEINQHDPEVEKAFREATEELVGTQRIAARISIHVRFGRHLLKIGKTEEGELELEQARLLSDLVAASSTSMVIEDVPIV